MKADLGQALAMLERAGSLGYGEGYDELGLMYVRGHGVRRDVAKARHYFEMAMKNQWEPARNHMKALR